MKVDTLIVLNCRVVDTMPGILVRRDGAVFRLYFKSGVVRKINGSRCRNGYLQTSVFSGGTHRSRYIHDIVTAAYLPPRHRRKIHTRHLDGNPLNNSVANLAYGTAAENSADASKHGRIRKGENSPAAKLTAESAREIFLSEEPATTLAKRKNVSRRTITCLWEGTTWKHITDNIVLPPDLARKRRSQARRAARRARRR